MAKLRKDGLPDKREFNGMQCYVPTTDDIEDIKICAACGIPVEKMCHILRISVDSWARILERQPEILAEYQNAEWEAKKAVGRTIWARATDPLNPDITAAIFYAKAKMGWRDREAPNTNNNILMISKDNYAEIRKEAERYRIGSIAEALSGESDNKDRQED